MTLEFQSPYLSIRVSETCKQEQCFQILGPNWMCLQDFKAPKVLACSWFPLIMQGSTFGQCISAVHIWSTTRAAEVTWMSIEGTQVPIQRLTFSPRGAEQLSSISRRGTSSNKSLSFLLSLYTFANVLQFHRKGDLETNCCCVARYVYEKVCMH